MSSPAERLAAGLADRYRLERKLGEGGMATVYLAEDLRHRRKVAIKLLHPELSAVIGAERFLKEIELTASLQHPHILPLFDSGAADGLLYYVMPFVDGETLRSRLERERQLPIGDAVRITRQVALALDYAHRHGVIHRDIKPENILLQEDSALVADFGIALAVQQAGGSRLTQTGMSLGTPQYMSPEQATGERNTDARTDIYALGAVAYEMIAGEPPFTGGTAQAVVAKVITEKPAPLASYRDTVPAHVAAAVHLALSKLAADRWASAREFATALEEGGWAAVPVVGRTTVALPARRPPRFGALAVAALLTLSSLALGVALGWILRRPAPRPMARLQIFGGVEGAFGMAFSPDGWTIALATPDSDLALGGRLYLRHLDRLHPEPVPGVDRAMRPVFSPDGRQIAYLRREGTFSSMWRVGLDGTPPVLVADSTSGGPGGPPSWGDDGYIYFGHADGALARVPASGGPVEKLARPGATFTGGFGQPQVLPNGKGVIFTQLQLSGGNNLHELAVWEAASGRVTSLRRGYSPRYAETGHLFFVDADGVLFRAPFDEDRLAISGPAEAIADRVRRPAPAIAGMTVSRAGDLLYRADARAADFDRRLTAVNRAGRSRPLPLPPDFYTSVRVSPDGHRLAYDVTVGANDGGNVFVVTLGDSISRQVSRAGINLYPTWTPDSRRLGYSRLLDGERDLVWQAADGSEAEQVLVRRPGDQFQLEFVPGSDRMLVREGNATGVLELDILVCDSRGDSIGAFAAAPRVLERAPRVSPDGRWVAYLSNETGRDEVFVRPFPDPGTGAAWQVSNGGGLEPVWSRTGRELFYKSSGWLVAATITTSPTFAVTARQRLFSVTAFSNNPWHARYDVLPGDTAFVMISTGGTIGEAGAQTILVQNATTGTSR